VAYSFLAFQNGDVFIGIGHDQGAFIRVHEHKQREIAVQQSKDPPLNRSG